MRAFENTQTITVLTHTPMNRFVGTERLLPDGSLCRLWWPEYPSTLKWSEAGLNPGSTQVAQPRGVYFAQMQQQKCLYLHCGAGVKPLQLNFLQHNTAEKQDFLLTSGLLGRCHGDATTHGFVWLGRRSVRFDVLCLNWSKVAVFVTFQTRSVFAEKTKKYLFKCFINISKPDVFVVIF